MSDTNQPTAAAPPPYQAVVVPDQGSAVRFTATTVDEFSTKLYALLMELGSGQCFVTVNGYPSEISEPRQSFLVKNQDGSLITVTEPGAGVFRTDGKFKILREPQDAGR
jgi:hypothetical protein